MSHYRIAASLCFCTLVAVGLAHGGTIQYQVTNVPGTSLQRYTYYSYGFTFSADEELDIVFDAALYGTLSNAKSSAGFDVMLFQPNVPTGVAGDFSSMALTNLGAVDGVWSVDFSYIGTGQPGSQTYYINQYSADGKFIRTVESGSTVLGSGQGAPEPGTLVLVGLVLTGLGVRRAVWRRVALG